MVSVTIKICSKLVSPKLSIRVSFHIPSNAFRPSTQSFQTISYKIQPLLRFLLSASLLVVIVPHTTRPHFLTAAKYLWTTFLGWFQCSLTVASTGRTIKGAGELYHRQDVISHCSLTIQVGTLTCSSYIMAFFFLLPCLCTCC